MSGGPTIPLHTPDDKAGHLLRAKPTENVPCIACLTFERPCLYDHSTTDTPCTGWFPGAFAGFILALKRAAITSGVSVSELGERAEWAE